jgi:hypothetical protein
MPASNDIAILTQTADFLIKYGFLAVGLALIFLVTPVIYNVWKAKNVGLATGCAGLAFVIAYGVIDIVQKTAPWLLSSQRSIISGVVLGVTDGYQIQMRSDRREAGQAYIKREFDREVRNLYNFPFILVTTDLPRCLSIGIASTDPNSENSRAFNVKPLSRDDMESSVNIIARVVPQQDALQLVVWRERQGSLVGNQATYKALTPDEGDCGTQTLTAHNDIWQWIGSAFAQGTLRFEEISSKLRSDDVFTRRDARIELSRQGTKGFDTIDQLLNQNNYRAQLGAVAALAEMPDEQRKQAPPSLRDKVRPLINNPDKTLRDAAVRALGEPAYCYQEEDKNKRPEQRYIALCHWTKAQCDATRGPNTRAGITQAPCQPVDLGKVTWNYTTGGTGGAWYQYGATEFKPPFPQLP